MDHILLVEDDKNLSFITKRLLESRGYAVMTAGTIAEAQELLRQHSYDRFCLTKCCRMAKERSFAEISARIPFARLSSLAACRII